MPGLGKKSVSSCARLLDYAEEQDGVEQETEGGTKQEGAQQLWRGEERDT